jgi:hypothetical protein
LSLSSEGGDERELKDGIAMPKEGEPVDDKLSEEKAVDETAVKEKAVEEKAVEEKAADEKSLDEPVKTEDEPATADSPQDDASDQ